MITSDARGIANQIGDDIVESQYMQSNFPNAGKKTAVRSRATRQCAMHGHRLSRVFYAARDAQSTIRAQWIIGRAMSAAAAADMLRIPFDHFVEQAHAATVRDVPLDPSSV